MKSIIYILLVLLPGTIWAQLGIHGQFLVQDVPNAEQPAINEQHIQSMYGYGISYWFRLKKIRWELSPTFMRYQSMNISHPELDIEQSLTGFQIQNNFYLMDFKNDCMCPTFSKQGEWLRKGFFVYVTPGFSSSKFKLNDSIIDDRIIAFGELGLGIDIGLNNIFTLSPTLGYRQLFGFQSSSVLQSSNSYNQIVSGLKLTVRWDKRNFY